MAWAAAASLLYRSGRVNWTYDFETNSINFAPDSTPEPGSQIRTEYSAECL